MLAERVRRSLRSPIKVGGKDVILTGSIGISVYDGEQQGPEQLLREAETAMYRAKRSGADRIELFKSDMRSESDDRGLLQTDLREAIEKRQLRILYQPIMRLSDRELAGMQVLVRWDHPKLGRLSLPEFLPIAEDLGIVSELGGYVLERGVRQAVRWQRVLGRGDDPVFVSINLSGRHFFKPEILQDLRLIIGRETAPKGALMLEINESLIMENPEQAIETLNLLKGLGANLCLDNFGASYSSLTYLHRLPFDMIKIDRQLLSYSGDRAGAVVFKSIVGMARELDKAVIASGVEHEDEDSYVKAIGCDFAQGFFYGEPLSERDVMALVQGLSRSSKKQEKRQRRREKVQATAAIPVPAGNGFDEAAASDFSSPPDDDLTGPLPPPVNADGNNFLAEQQLQTKDGAFAALQTAPDWQQAAVPPVNGNGGGRQQPPPPDPLPDIGKGPAGNSNRTGALGRRLFRGRQDRRGR